MIFLDVGWCVIWHPVCCAQKAPLDIKDNQRHALSVLPNKTYGPRTDWQLQTFLLSVFPNPCSGGHRVHEHTALQWSSSLMLCLFTVTLCLQQGLEFWCLGRAARLLNLPVSSLFPRQLFYSVLLAKTELWYCVGTLSAKGLGCTGQQSVVFRR